MYTFRDIAASDAIFIKTREKFKTELDDFKKYAQMMTDEAGKAKTKSGKASSYTRYLIRLIIFNSEVNDIEINSLSSFESLKKIEKIKFSNDFKRFNEQANHFYSATLSCYLAYVIYSNSADEEVRDRQFNDSLNDKINIIEEDNSYLLTEANTKPSRSKMSDLYVYPRNYMESLEAKERGNWVCEFNQLHKTFINIKNDKPYVEAHHLIPMAAQDYYENTIDFADNIVCLCSTCHSRIHHAIQSEKKEMIVELFKKRESLYSTHGIQIDMKLLLSFYGIL
nr:HNH endonuclease [Carnobacterium maltaromaticum]